MNMYIIYIYTILNIYYICTYIYICIILHIVRASELCISRKCRFICQVRVDGCHHLRDAIPALADPCESIPAHPALLEVAQQRLRLQGDDVHTKGLTWVDFMYVDVQYMR